jgi:hypothetical protein
MEERKMSKQNDVVADAGAETSVDKTARRRREKPLEGADSATLLKVALPHEQSELVRQALKTLRDRGAILRVEELLSEVIETITPERMERAILAYTPDEYYLREARNIPDLHALLIRHAKKAVLGGGERRVRRKKATEGHAVCSEGTRAVNAAGVL